MNIQIFGTKKCNETKKAQRYFKERGIKFQFIDMSEKEISKGEFRSVSQAVGGIQAMINIGVAVGAFPVTGIPLPFISYGGSSLIFMMATVGFLLNLSKYAKK